MMGEYRTETVSRDNLASGRLRGAVVTGLAAGLAAASLGAVGTASATCIGLSGINIGEGCTTSLGSFALGLGDGTVATSEGFLNGAIATGTDTEAYAEGALNFVVAGGEGTYAQAIGTLNSAVAGLGFAGLLGVGTRVNAVAGAIDGDFLNFALNFASAEEGTENTADASYGAVNLAANILGKADSGKDMIVYAGGSDEVSPGYGTVAVNISGNRSRVTAIGRLNNATNWGNELTYPNGSDSEVTAGDIGDPATLSWAFNIQHVFTQACSVEPCGNGVKAGPGPFAVAGAIGVIGQNVEQAAAGINIKTRLNAALKNLKTAPPAAAVRNSVSDGITRSAQRFNDNVRRVTGGPGGGPKAAAADVGKRGRGDSAGTSNSDS